MQFSCHFNSSLTSYCFLPLFLAGDPCELFPGTSLSGTNVTCGEDLADVLVRVLRSLRGGLPSSGSESSLDPPGTEPNEFRNTS